MKIIYHPLFGQQIDDTPAGDKERLEPCLQMLAHQYPNVFVRPELAEMDAIRRAHTASHIVTIQKSGTFQFHKKNDTSRGQIFDFARLAAGGAILAAEFAHQGDPSFALIRPPGHHASADSCWGFCYFCNMAIALLHLRAHYNVHHAFILDFDLHTGDGNINILGKYHSTTYPDYEIINPDAFSEEEYLENVKTSLKNAHVCQIVAVSAGFDQGKEDWGKLLSPQAYETIGSWLKTFALKHCEGHRFAILEGGYNSEAMAQNLYAFLKGFF